MKSFSQFVHSRLMMNDDEPPGELPTLPAIRSPLSRQPSREQLQSATSQSLLFQKLPPEIRRCILIYAFGGQTVHIDLSHQHPPSPQAGPRYHIGHCGLPLTRPDNGFHARASLDVWRKKRWQWKGSVCHRNGPDPGPPGYRVNAAQDTCRHGVTGGRVCQLWPGKSPDNCKIGAMGWLKTCRQAYTEGVDVLYATNTFHTASQDLMMNIHDLIPTRRLERISSVELVWEIPIAPPLHDGADPFKSLRPFWSFLDAVPAMFSNAKKIHVAVHWHPKYLSHLFDTFSEISFACTQSGVIDRVDGLVRKLRPNIDFSLAIPSSMYRPRKVAARKISKIEQAIDNGKYERYWWNMYGKTRPQGYWVYLGLKDLEMPTEQEATLVMKDPSLIVEDDILYRHCPSKH